MIFEEVKESASKKNGEAIEVMESFYASGIKVAEIKDWDGAYKNVDSTYNALKNLSRSVYKNKVKVTKNSGHIYLERIEK